MRGFDTRSIKGADLAPISWERAQAIMRPAADDGRYYLCAFCALAGAWLFDAIQERHKAEEMPAVCTIWNGWPFVVAAIKKETLPPAEYAELVRRYMGVAAGAIEDGCVDIRAPPWAMHLCGEMVIDLFGGPAGNDLAMEA
jgi:hypothetical protein